MINLRPDLTVEHVRDAAGSTASAYTYALGAPNQQCANAIDQALSRLTGTLGDTKASYGSKVDGGLIRTMLVKALLHLEMIIDPGPAVKPDHMTMLASESLMLLTLATAAISE